MTDETFVRCIVDHPGGRNPAARVRRLAGGRVNMPVIVAVMAYSFQIIAVFFFVLAFIIISDNTSAETEALSLVGGLMAVYGIATEAVVIGLIKRRSWARTVGLVLF